MNAEIRPADAELQQAAIDHLERLRTAALVLMPWWQALTSGIERYYRKRGYITEKQARVVLKTANPARLNLPARICGAAA